LDLANITNQAAKCALVFGSPQKIGANGNPSILPGSQWSTPVYTCIGVAKASIKTVNFRLNVTNDLSGLQVLSINPKSYPNDTSKPIWAVERSDMPLAAANPLWGPVSSDAAEKWSANISTLQKESLFIPGSTIWASVSRGQSDNLAATEFAAGALSDAFNFKMMSKSSFDYSGASSLAMSRQWQQLSKTPESMGKVFALIWTDLVANSVVGTKTSTNQAGAPEQEVSKAAANDQKSSTLVTIYQRTIKYHIVYAIPGIIALAMIVLVAVLTVVATIIGHTGAWKMRRYLDATSAGRLLTAPEKEAARLEEDQRDSSEAVEAGDTSKVPIITERQSVSYTSLPRDDSETLEEG
jgi:hypothetical protein